MHNHIAVRLMSFVLEHRPHTRYGSQPMVYRREFEYEEEMYVMEFDRGGYNFVLDEPLPVETLEGRIRGQVKEPIEVALPRYDREQEAYVMPDGQWVTVDRFGTVTPREMPFDFEAPLEAPSGEGSTASTESGMPSTAPAAIPINTSVLPLTPAPVSQ
jgi:hypothetical protein